MGLFSKVDTKSKAVDFAKYDIQDAVQEKVAEVEVYKTLDYDFKNAGSIPPW